MLRTHPTPNPRSLKITDEAGRTFIDSGLSSFRSPEEAQGDPLGEALFALGGIVDVLVLPSFATITLEHGADWDAIWPRAEAILEQHLDAA